MVAETPAHSGSSSVRRIAPLSRPYRLQCPDGDIMADGTTRPREPQPVKG
jgi:hypothetical protein